MALVSQGVWAASVSMVKGKTRVHKRSQEFTMVVSSDSWQQSWYMTCKTVREIVYTYIELNLSTFVYLMKGYGYTIDSIWPIGLEASYYGITISYTEMIESYN